MVVIGAFLFAGFPASAIGQFFPFGSAFQAFLLVAVCELVCFPIMVLSALESGTLFPPLSLNVLRTIQIARPAWVRFWIESAVLVLPLGAAFHLIVGRYAIWADVVSAGLVSLTLLVYFRRMGVLGWSCARAINTDTGG